MATARSVLGTATAQMSVPADYEPIEGTIHDYLLTHPEVIVEALRAAQVQEKEKQAAASRAPIAKAGAMGDRDMGSMHTHRRRR